MATNNPKYLKMAFRESECFDMLSQWIVPKACVIDSYPSQVQQQVLEDEVTRNIRAL